MFDTVALENDLTAAMTSERIPALAIAVTDRERILYAQGFGTTAADDTGQPVTAQTLFRIASTTKPLTAALIMSLIEANLLDLDEPIMTHIPELRLSLPDATEQVTARQLLSHRAGLPPGGEELGFTGPNALLEFVEELLPEYQLVAPPGVLHSYSNPGYSLLGHLAERVTGEPYGKLMNDRIFAPLGMNRTTFDPLVALTYPLALPHRLQASGNLEPVHHFYDEPAGWPAGFAMTSVTELAGFAQMLLNNGSSARALILEPHSVKEMFSPQADMLTASGDSYGLGVFLRSYKGTKLVEHGGSMPTYEAAFTLAPEPGLGIIVISNRPHTGATASLTTRLLDEILELPNHSDTSIVRSTGNLDHEAFVKAAGAYVGKRRGLVRLGLEGQSPWMELNGRHVPLRAVREGVYASDLDNGTTSVGIVPNHNRPTQFILLEGVICERTELTDVRQPDNATLERLCGRYESFDVIDIKLDSGTLILISQMYGERRMTCQPLGGLRFASDYGVTEFVEDAAGSIAQLIAWDQFPLMRTDATSESGSGSK